MYDPRPNDHPASPALALYSAIYGLCLPFLAPVLAHHPRLSGGFAQRLGLLGPVAGRAGSTRPVWLHGSSAGDIVALIPLARMYAESTGRLPIVSTWTRTGAEMAHARLGAAAAVIRAPLDLAGPVRAVVDRLHPGLLVLECLELWPRLVSTCHARGVPVAVANGRLSGRSLRRYVRARWLFEPCFKGLARVVARTPEDASRFVEAGVPAARVTVGANTKYARLALHHGDPAGRVRRAKVVLGSLHAAEERELLPAIPRLLETHPAVEIVVAPRYPHRASATRRYLSHLGVASESGGPGGRIGAPPPRPHRPRVLVLDTMGQLERHYADARVAFVGGSLTPRGGHNLVEPAALGCPVLFGPHTHNCGHEAELLIEQGGGARVRSGGDFLRRTASLLDEPRCHAERSAGALRAAAALVAGAQRTVSELLSLDPCHHELRERRA